jgi:hypothetical protein
MATSGEHKSFCALDFHVNKYVVSVQRHFPTKYGTDRPSGQSVQKWYLQFQDMGCICKRKSTGRPSTEEEAVERVRTSFVRSLRPPRSPHLTPRDYFSLGFIKDRVFVPPVPVTLVDLRTCITAVITVIDHDILQIVWQELDYRFYVCRVKGGAHIEHL